MWPQVSKQRIRTTKDSIRNRVTHKDLYYLVEGANWSIDHDGRSITTNLRDISSMVVTTCRGIRNSIVHFGSVNTFLRNGGLRLPHKSNRIIITWFHISPGDKRVEFIPEAVNCVDLWHASCSLTRSKLISFGIPEEKIEMIPLGVNLKAFCNPSKIQKRIVHTRLGIPQRKVVIGSFQKDGNGWGEGLEPKLIKGPDVLCDVITQLAKQYELFVLLTGPARGYVKRRLEKASIPYLHHILNNPDEVAEYYKALDLYIVASREEGGPKAIMESLASGVPLVSTKVGMAPDVIRDGISGFLCEIENVNEIVKKSVRIIEDVALRKKMVEKGLDIARQFDWSNIAQRYEQLLYRPLL
ncbi:MAG: glycosyltransferase family 4 protein [Desulfobacteraceae bacterium]|nr:glycosyltransferase family 4 protein [Desulfobacteraceae bacterium]